MPVATYTKSGTKATTPAKLDSFIFNTDVKSHELIKQAYVAYQANGRENLAKTLRRGEVRGGGKKPWKQKGTGRARFGSIRVPIWRGGGITFGPLGKENYSKKLNVKAKRTAIRQALTLNKDNISVIESVDSKNVKTADIAKLLQKVHATGSVLLVVVNKDEALVKATNNLKNVTLVQATYLNVFNVMNAGSIIITKDALTVISEWLGENTDKKETPSDTKAKEDKK